MSTDSADTTDPQEDTTDSMHRPKNIHGALEHRQRTMSAAVEKYAPEELVEDVPEAACRAHAGRVLEVDSFMTGVVFVQGGLGTI